MLALKVKSFIGRLIRLNTSAGKSVYESMMKKADPHPKLSEKIRFF